MSVPHQPAFGRGLFAHATTALPAATGRYKTASVGFFGPDLTAYAKQIDAAVDAHQLDVINDQCRPDIIRCSGRTGAHKIPSSPKYPYPAGTKTVSIPYLTAWTNWAQSWSRYYNEQINDVFGSPTREALDQWKSQLDGFIAQFKKFGGTPTTPPLPGLPTEAGIPWTGLLVVGGFIAAAFFLREAKGLLPTPAPAAGGTPYRLPPKGGSSAPASQPVIHDAQFIEDPTDSPRTVPSGRRAASYDHPGASYEGPVSSVRSTRRTG